MIQPTIAAIGLSLLMGRAAAQPERSSSIAGQVVNATTGAPLRRAAVTIVLDSRDDVCGMAPTDAEGHFLLRLLPAGRYRIEVSKPGYAAMNYGARVPSAPGQIITLGPDENKSGLVIRLPQLGSISGTVRAVGGAPAFGSSVQSFARVYSNGKPVWEATGQSNVDGRGRYRIYGLKPGQYIVRATQSSRLPPAIANGPPTEPPGGQLAPAPTYYTAALTEWTATPLQVGPGGTVTEVDITIQEMLPIRLGVKALLPGAAPAPPADTHATAAWPEVFFSVWINPADGASEFLHHSFRVSTDRFYEARALQPGRYILTGMGRVKGLPYYAREEVDLSGGSVDLSLPFTAGEELTGRIRFDGQPPDAPSEMDVRLRSADNQYISMSSAGVHPDGSFTIPGVPPGVWNVSVGSLPKGAYLQSMRFGAQDVLARESLTTASSLERLEIVIGTRGAELRGRIVEGVATIVLAAPQGERATRMNLYATAGVDENGRFEFSGLTPGTYKIYGFEELAPRAWTDPEFLRNYPESGKLVELREGPGEEIQVKAEPGWSDRKGGR